VVFFTAQMLGSPQGATSVFVSFVWRVGWSPALSGLRGRSHVGLDNARPTACEAALGFPARKNMVSLVLWYRLKTHHDQETG